MDQTVLATIIVVLTLALAFPGVLAVEYFLKEFSSRGRLKNLTLKIDDMTGIEFEHFLKRLYELDGYRVSTTKISGDQGGDLIMERNGEKTVVQIKRSRAPVGNGAVQEVLGAKGFYRARKSIVVTNNTFTPAAWQLAMSNYVSLVDRKRLTKLIYQHLGQVHF